MILDMEFMETNTSFDAPLEESNQAFFTNFTNLQVVHDGEGDGTSDHNALYNRDIDDQHPMSAITGLEKALSEKQPKGSYLTKETDPTVPNWAKQPNKPTYTASEVGAIPSNIKIPSKTSDLDNDSGFATEQYVRDKITEAEIGGEDIDLSDYAKKDELPTKTSQLTNDSGYITDYTETDPTVPSWAKKATKPTYTADEVGALPDTTVIPSKVSQLDNDSGYLTEHQSLDEYATEQYVTDAISEIPTPDVSGQISAHNVATDAHNDIRLLIVGLTQRINALADSDDTTLDQMSEVVAYIKDNRELIEQVTTAKISVTDIIDNLTTNVSNKPLSAAQGVVMKGLVDSLTTAVGGKLDASALTDAVNAALAQAKESGEFDGADGSNGSDGEPGYTPVKGTDYWTDTDKQEIVAETVEALPVYEGENEETGEASGGGSIELIAFSGAINTGTSGDTADGQKWGNVVQVTLALTSASSGSTTGAVQMPYVPAAETRSFIANPSGKLCRIILRTTGMLDIYPVEDGATKYYGQIVYITPNEGG